MELIYEYIRDGFDKALSEREEGERRIGAELKFPLVDADGAAVRYETVRALWSYLEERGWEPVRDSASFDVVGARRPGEQNDTVASCETGYCKTEFSLAHVANLHELKRSVDELRTELTGFARAQGVHFLGYGIHPVTPPSKRLLMKKSRTSVWDKVFPSNRHIPPEDGDDFHLFTINAASHLHAAVSRDEAIPAVNVLNGFTGAQIALTADSNIWRGREDPEYKCVAEKFWDWWMPDTGRVGIPPRPFDDLRDYVHTVARLRPVYVKRRGQPIVLDDYETFDEYFNAGEPKGTAPDGGKVMLYPDRSDIDLHNTCYWYNARLSRYYTVENRVCDQQPPGELMCVAALTLGLLSALPEAGEALAGQSWESLRAAREAACRDGLSGEADGLRLADFAGTTVELAELGLKRRGMGEERWLGPLKERVRRRRCPADDAAEVFAADGPQGLVADRSFQDIDKE
jgi:gamma-glutamylcysteine synthetase